MQDEKEKIVIDVAKKVIDKQQKRKLTLEKQIKELFNLLKNK